MGGKAGRGGVRAAEIKREVDGGNEGNRDAKWMKHPTGPLMICPKALVRGHIDVHGAITASIVDGMGTAAMAHSAMFEAL